MLVLLLLFVKASEAYRENTGCLSIVCDADNIPLYINGSYTGKSPLPVECRVTPGDTARVMMAWQPVMLELAHLEKEYQRTRWTFMGLSGWILLLFACEDPETEYHSIVISGNESILIGPHDTPEILNNGTWCFEILFSMDTLIFPENRTLLSVILRSQSVLSGDSVSYRHLLSPSDTLIRAVATDPVWDYRFHLMALNMNHDASRIELRADNAHIGTSGSHATAIPDSGNRLSLKIGEDVRDPNSLDWTALIDECRLWNKDLSSDLISFHRSNPSKLTVHYDQDEGNAGLFIPDEGRYGMDALIQSPSGAITRSTHHTPPL